VKSRQQALQSDFQRPAKREEGPEEKGQLGFVRPRSIRSERSIGAAPLLRGFFHVGPPCSFFWRSEQPRLATRPRVEVLVAFFHACFAPHKANFVAPQRN